MRRVVPLILLASVAAYAAACGGDGGSAAPETTGPDAGVQAPDASPLVEDAGLVDAMVVDSGPPRCKPKGGGPYWVEEGQPVLATVSCAGAPAVVTVAPLPAGATFDDATKQLTWTPTLAQAGVYVLTVTVPSTGETATFKIGVADKFDDPANVPLDPLTYTEEFGLPVLHLDTSPTISDAAQTPASIRYRGHVYSAEAKYRGAASLQYPKKSFTVKFDKLDKFNEPYFPPAGFLKKRTLVLMTTFDDNAYVRNRLAFEMWNKLDPTHIRVQHYSAVVVLNGQYQGLYAVTDHVDGYLMEDHDLLQEGNLYKAVTHDANFKLTKHTGGAAKTILWDGFEKQEGLPEQGQPGAFDDLVALVNFVATSDQATFAAGIGTRIDVKAYQDWLILTTAIEARDTLGKNSYHYHDPAGGLFQMVPWDFNASFGQTWQTKRDPPNADPEAISTINHLFTRFLTEPAFAAALKTRYDATLKKEISQASVMAALDVMLAEVDKCARRDERKWRAKYLTYAGWSTRTDFTDFDGEVAYTKQWIKDRWTWLDAKY